MCSGENGTELSRRCSLHKVLRTGSSLGKECISSPLCIFHTCVFCCLTFAKRPRRHNTPS